MRIKRPIAAALVATAGIVGGGFALAGAQETPPSVGGIPDDAFTDNGIDLNRVPDFVAVVGRDGDVVGYIRKEDMFSHPQPASPEEAVALNDDVSVYDVFDATAENVIGHWVGGATFVPRGGDVDAAVQAVRDGTAQVSITETP